MFLYLNFEVFFSIYCLFKISPTLMGDITFSKSKITYSKSDTCITFFSNILHVYPLFIHVYGGKEIDTYFIFLINCYLYPISGL